MGTRKRMVNRKRRVKRKRMVKSKRMVEQAVPNKTVMLEMVKQALLARKRMVKR